MKKEGRRAKFKTFISDFYQNEEDCVREQVGEEKKGGFFACYLLCSLCPRFKDHTYIGFTINPCRRIRQHNGEITSGASSTQLKRPWEMILCIYGFPTNVSALKFEWAWQHPTGSLVVKKPTSSLESLPGIGDNIKLAYKMLNLPPWQSMNLTVNFLSTKYINDAVGCPSLPKQVKVQICPMDELPCYTGGRIFNEMDEMDDLDDEDDEEEGEEENGANKTHFEGLVNISSQHCKYINTLGLTEMRSNEHWQARMQQLVTPLYPNEHQPSFASGFSPPKFSYIKPNDKTHFRGLVNISSRQCKDINTLGLTEMCRNEHWQAWKKQLLTPLSVNEHQPSSTNGPLSPKFRCTQPNDLSISTEDHFRVQFPHIDSPVTVNTLFPSNSSLVETVDTSEGKDRGGLLSPEFGYMQTDDQSTQREEDCRQQFSLVDTPVKTVQKSCYLDVLSPDQYPVTSAKSPLAPPKVEVIDIITPPSSDRVISCFRTKKRLNNWVSQGIIDLTKSPNKFLHL
ncbi:hypothetical protein IFM89_028889 [Coptis chinensis]|uniref:Structure-specific endonuclease subunit SLX1 homolog n=1 Tax=Coptis chinensis TaxID=261450 RepID=A0A835LJ03_9MAGN|nr:hypothetical protein IFM89_028889 [Coptis chinensis]